MAQYVFDASKYPNGTLLSELDWVNTDNPVLDYTVTEIGATGRKYWKETITTLASCMTMPDEYTEYEVLALLDCTRTEQGNPTYHGLPISYGNAVGASSPDTFFRADAYVNSGNSLTFAFTSFSGTLVTNTAPTGFLTTKAIASRISFNSTTGNHKFRTWAAAVGGLEAAEPGTWNGEYTGGLSIARAPATPRNLGNPTYTSRFTSISIGTDGDAAPYPDNSVVVTAPTLTMSNITATTATASWT